MAREWLEDVKRDIQAEYEKLDENLLNTLEKCIKAKRKPNDAQSQYADNIRILHDMSKICKDLDAADGRFEKYVKVYTRRLLPCWELTNFDVVPDVDTTMASYWSSFLSLSGVFYNTLRAKKRFSEADEVFKGLVQLKNKLRNPTDYKFFLTVYGLHFHYVVCQKKIKTNPVYFLEAYQQLFSYMLKCNAERNFEYPDLINAAQKSIFSDNIRYNLECLVKSSTEKFKCLFESFLMLNQKSSAKSPEEAKASFKYCRQMFYSLLICDEMTNWTLDLSAKFLRSCRESSEFKKVYEITYFLGILYQYTRVCFINDTIRDFNTVYIKIGSKVLDFFEQATDLISQETWLQEALSAFFFLQTTLQPKMDAAQSRAFWIQMNNADVQWILMKIIEKFVNLVKYLDVQLPCCASMSQSATESWKHFLSNCVINALTTMAVYYKNSGQEDEISQPKIKEIHDMLGRIFQQLTDSLENCKCSTLTSSILQNIEAVIFAFTRAIQKPHQAYYILSISEKILPLKEKYGESRWKNLMCCLYKISEATNNPQLVRDYKCCFIATLLVTAEHKKENRDNICGHIYRLYKNHESKSDAVCILELYENSKNAFMPSLTKAQKCCLYYLDLQNFFSSRHNNDNEKFILSLIKFSQSTYQYVLLVESTSKLRSKSKYMEKVHNICKYYKNKKTKKSSSSSDGLTYLEELTLGHGLAAIIAAESESKTSEKMNSAKLTVSILLDELRNEEDLGGFNTTVEWQSICVITEAVEAFKAFYEKACKTPTAAKDDDIDFAKFLETVTMLATRLYIAGYLNEAMEAWVLHYQAARKFQEFAWKTFSLAFFCEHSALIKSRPDLDIDVDREIELNEKFLVEILEDLPNLSSKHQNSALICLAHLAYYKACKQNDETIAKLYINLGRYYCSQLSNRVDKYDSIQLTFDLVEFRVMSHHQFSSNASINIYESTLQTKLRFVCENLKILTYPTYIDNYFGRLLLFNVFLEFGKCLANRMYCGHIESYFATIMKQAIEKNSALRAIQILTTWSYLNLQQQNIERAELLIQIAEVVLGVKTPQTARNSKNAVTAPTCNKETAIHQLKSHTVSDNKHLLLGIEVVRDVPMPPKLPKKQFYSPVRMASGLNHLKWIFFALHESKILQLNKAFQWSYFILGCLKARRDFLLGEHNLIQDFYVDCQRWVKKEKQLNYLNPLELSDIVMLITEHYVNFLRRHNGFDQVFLYIEKFETLNDKTSLRRLDTAHLVNLQQQLNASHLALNERRMKKKNNLMISKKIVKTLDFHLSNEESEIEEAIIPKISILEVSDKLDKCNDDSREANESLESSTTSKVNLDECQFVEISDSSYNEEEAKTTSIDEKLNGKSNEIVEVTAIQSTTTKVLSVKKSINTASKSTMTEAHLLVNNKRILRNVRVANKSTSPPFRNVACQTVKLSGKLLQPVEIPKKFDRATQTTSLKAANGSRSTKEPVITAPNANKCEIVDVDASVSKSKSNGKSPDAVVVVVPVSKIKSSKQRPPKISDNSNIENVPSNNTDVNDNDNKPNTRRCRNRD